MEQLRGKAPSRSRASKKSRRRAIAERADRKSASGPLRWPCRPRVPIPQPSARSIWPVVPHGRPWKTRSFPRRFSEPWHSVRRTVRGGSRSFAAGPARHRRRARRRLGRGVRALGLALDLSRARCGCPPRLGVGDPTRTGPGSPAGRRFALGFRPRNRSPPDGNDQPAPGNLFLICSPP